MCIIDSDVIANSQPCAVTMLIISESFLLYCCLNPLTGFIFPYTLFAIINISHNLPISVMDVLIVVPVEVMLVVCLAGRAGVI
jgi:hypothetical protein